MVVVAAVVMAKIQCGGADVAGLDRPFPTLRHPILPPHLLRMLLLPLLLQQLQPQRLVL